MDARRSNAYRRYLALVATASPALETGELELLREAADAALDYGFGALGLEEIVAFTAVGNLASRRLMERLGMRYDEGADFDHPALKVDHPLTPHVLYRLRRNG